MSTANGRGDVERDLLEIPELAGAATAPSSSVRDALLATVSDERRFEGFLPRAADLLDFPQERVRELLLEIRGVAGPRWEDGRVPGVRLFHFHGGPRVRDAHCGIVQVQPGVSYPMHQHQGDEKSLVLGGTAQEDTGRVWAPGDLLLHPAGSRHEFTALGPEPFVFLVVLHGDIDHI